MSSKTVMMINIKLIVLFLFIRVNQCSKSVDLSTLQHTGKPNLGSDFRKMLYTPKQGCPERPRPNDAKNTIENKYVPMTTVANMVLN